MNEIIYFDNAATTFPKPEEVYKFMDSCYREMGVNVGRGQYNIASKANSLVEETRELLKDMFNCSNKDVILLSSATEAINLAIRGLDIKEGDNIYITPFEHNAVTRVLYQLEKHRKVKIIELDVNEENYEYNINSIEEQFDENRPSVVIMTHASNVCGIVTPIEEISKLAKKHRSKVILDIAQTAGVLKLDLNSELYDIAAFAGHKGLYGPFGVGGLIMKPDISLKPVLFGGTGINSAEQDVLKESPERYEVGSKNIIAISGLNASLKWLENIGINKIIESDNKKAKKVVEIIRKYNNIKLIGENDNSIGVKSISFENYTPDEIGYVLNGLNIAVRTGLHCSPTAHKFLGTYPEGTVRISLSYFTTDKDLDQLDKAFKYIKDNS